MNIVARALLAGLSVLLVSCGESAPDSEREARSAGPAATPEPQVAEGPAQVLVLVPAEPPSGETSEDCSLDVLNGTKSGAYTLRSKEKAEIAGWIADREAHQVPPLFRVALVGSKSFAANAIAGRYRPDVAAALADPALSKSGYRAILDLTSMEPGSYRLVLSFDSDKQQFVCSPGIVIDIQD
jgi:hypothetical protein